LAIDKNLRAELSAFAAEFKSTFEKPPLAVLKVGKEAAGTNPSRWKLVDSPQDLKDADKVCGCVICFLPAWRFALTLFHGRLCFRCVSRRLLRRTRLLN
jgi:hypothetical protein